MNKINRHQTIIAIISIGLMVTGCSTTITPQVDASRDLTQSIFTDEINFPLAIEAVHHSPVPEDAIGLAEFAFFLANKQNHESAGLIYLKMADIKSSNNQLAVDALSGAAIQFFLACNRAKFLSTAEKLELIVNTMEYQIIGEQTQEILNLFLYFKSGGRKISSSLRFLAPKQSDEFGINQ